ncbi:13111_t:CDS:2 [Entrophospora sp. SA101]|nr:13111_t:CDS:2 [Entrophospora sp. SA101]
MSINAININYQRLPTRQHITEINYTGRSFSRKRINHEIEKLRTRIPNKKFQVLLPYEQWKPGSWFEDGEDISLFSLLDRYDESQLPEGGGDPGSYNRFIIYMMDPPALSGGCNAKKDSGLNDCLYQCLYHAYGTFSNLPKIIKKPEILKQALGLQRNEAVPVELIEKVEKLAKTIAINIPKEPLIYKMDGINNTVKIFNGKDVCTVTTIEWQKLQSKSRFGKNCYIPVVKDKNSGIYESLDEAYTRIHEE